jgi:hypothetical protein
LPLSSARSQEILGNDSVTFPLRLIDPRRSDDPLPDDKQSQAFQFLLRPNRRFEFHERRQLFIRVRNETLSVVAGRIGHPDRSPVGINR